MKLYTEDQIRLLLDLAKLKINGEMYSKDVLLQQVTPIELPSDEEIDEESIGWWAPSAFRAGAKWVIEQIKQQDGRE
jgi:hypothetical protein